MVSNPDARGHGSSHGPSVSSVEVIAFATRAELWAWLAEHADSHPGAWVRLTKSGRPTPSVSFHDLLEAGIAYGWSESTRRGYDADSYLQKFTPRRRPGTTSGRNRAIAERLEAAGLMTDAGRAALGL
ncbi:YdeI/OmpD-associated family protein [Nostocoides jenkinsii]|uniref:Uncharacterized protein n=1 Tax=Nostocoides jenkinsii Ben 74 TaxID=1193518 RepID=A0A077MDF8_9MICO|nr:hypothetical protein [Tetrasphaera jenkinsii]CCI53910.1 conserved hypothetical protein [Tetrasphaera jenkinsii Ben 74]